MPSACGPLRNRAHGSRLVVRPTTKLAAHAAAAAHSESATDLCAVAVVAAGDSDRRTKRVDPVQAV